MRTVSAQEYRVNAIDISPLPCSSPNVIAIIGDLNEQTTIMSIENALKSLSPEAIYWFHFAALFPKSFDSRGELTWDKFETNNVQATRNLIAIAKKHQETNLLFFPSTAHLGREKDATGSQLDFYGRSKDINEKELTACHELRTVVWRLPRIIGIQAASPHLSQTGIEDIYRLHDTFNSLRRSGELPEDIVSTFLLRATENPRKPTLSITNAMLKRTYAHISELNKSLVDMIGSNAHGDCGPARAPFPIEEVTLHQIGMLVVEELRVNGIPIRFVHDGNVQELAASESLAQENRIHSVVQRTVREYFSLAVQCILSSDSKD